MSSNFERFEAVWMWHRVAVRALDVFEHSAVEHPQQHIEALQTESPASVLAGIQTCREEMENFALLSLWALFEEAINDWLIQRVRWVGAAVPALDNGIRQALQRRIQHWTIGEKIDALKAVVGDDTTRELHKVRKWRDWVAHRKAGARPAACDFEMAQSLFTAVLAELERCPFESVLSID